MPYHSTSWSSYNPVYSSLLLYQDKYGATDRPFGKQADPYMTATGDRHYSVRGNELRRFGRPHDALLESQRYTSNLSWEVQRQMVQTEVPYSRSVQARRILGDQAPLLRTYEPPRTKNVAPPGPPPPPPGCTRCARCNCGGCGCHGGGGGHPLAAPPMQPSLRSSALALDSAGTRVGRGGDDDDDGRVGSRFLLHKRFPSTRIGTRSWGVGGYSRPARRFTVAGLHAY